MEQENKQLTAKEKRFCEEYLVDQNATKAAIRAGYSARSAYSIGWANLRKHEIFEHITAMLKEHSLNAEEVTKMLSDIAKSSLNDFFTIKQIEHTPRIVKPLTDIVREIEAEITFEAEYAKVAQYDDKEMEAYQAGQKRRHRTVARYNLELKANPSATRIVNGETVFIDHAELDMVKLVKAKEEGRIKSISYNSNGMPKVELYAADAALVALARMYGLYIDNVRHSVAIKIGKDLQDEEYV